jgi:hypothetical protein
LSIDRYIGDLETAIASHSFVSSYTLTIDRKTSDIAYLSGMIEFRNGTALDFKEFIESKGRLVEKYLYGYNHRLAGEVIFRYDNSPDPHAKTLATFPHHKHLQSGEIIESDGLIDLSAVLEEIEGAYAQEEE